MDRYKGYTMIELVVIIALFSIILSIAVPNFEIINKFKEELELKEINRDILYARNQAIITGKVYYFELSYEENGYSIYSEDGVHKEYKLQYGLNLIHNPEVMEIVFGGNGVPLQSGTISLENSDGEIYLIAITPITGKVNINLYE